MIVGLLSDVSKQKHLLPAAIARALEALQTLELSTVDVGRYELEGDQLFYLIQDVETRTIDESKSEAHHRYADIQIPLSTAERFGFSLPQANLVATEDRLESGDIAFYPAPANEFFMTIEPGAYVVFFPEELHRPCLMVKEKGKLRKVVIKVHASLLGL
jgi:biofilm protein TabA